MQTNRDSLDTIIRHAKAEFEGRYAGATAPLQDVAAEFSLGQIGRNIGTLRDRLMSEVFRVMVVGRFNVGKSTFLNALLNSTAVGLPPGQGLLPVDRLPCTAVLTTIRYAPEPIVLARHFDGHVEHWTFEDYLQQARIYAETATPVGTMQPDSRLASIHSFEIGLPVELLRGGVEVVDSPGLSEDPARTTITCGALSRTDASLFVFRSDMAVGLDEQAALLEVLDETGHVFPVVNMFHGEQPTPRLRQFLNARLAGPRAAPQGEKLDPEIAYVDAQTAFNGYAAGDPESVARSGMVDMERRLGRFLIEGSYRTKTRASIDGAKAVATVLDSELGKIINAASADSASVAAVLEQCDADMRDIRERRDRVADIIDRMVDRAVADTRTSYQTMCRELTLSLDGRFAERPLSSLSSTAGKLGSLVTQRAAREAREALNGIIDEQLTRWGSAPPTENGLQRDLMPGLESARRELEREYEGITARLNAISLQIARVNPDVMDGEPAVSLQDRLLSAGLGVVALGPLGAVFAVTGMRGVAGAALGVAAAKAALIAAATSFGMVFSWPVVVAIALGAVTFGAGAGALYKMEQRIRSKALEAAKRAIREMALEGGAILEITESIAASLREGGEAVMASLDAILREQEESLENLRVVNRGTLEAKQELAMAAQAARERIATVRTDLTALEAEARRVPDAAAA